ncbi:MAG TPA: OsmC family protein [Vicinamibacterales bacterium]|jgi:uncharacterized OsmC-like protein
MDLQQLKSLQAPLKERYRVDPPSATITLRAAAETSDEVTSQLTTGLGRVTAGLHPAAGGDGTLACPGDMLLEALVACAGVTLRAVATGIGVFLRSARVTAEGDLDFRGTLGVAREVPVGFREIRLTFQLDTDASDEQRATLIRLTERYCVVLRTLRDAPPIVVGEGV